MQFQITAGTGESVKVEAENWMGAMAKAMVFFDAGPDTMVRWVVQPMDEGKVAIDDTGAGSNWVVEPVPERVVKVIAVSPRLAERQEREEPRAAAPRERERYDPDAAPPPTLAMPASSIRQEAPPEPEPPPEPEVEEFFSHESLAERLFDLSMDMASVGPNKACRLALDIALEAVPCEAASVVRGSLNDEALTFVAASGPVANELIGKRLPFGTGITGMAFDKGMTVIVNDVHEESRHFTRFDAETGFETRAVLTVPVLDETLAFAVIQLINPEDPFENKDVEAVEMVAQSLAGALAAQR